MTPDSSSFPYRNPTLPIPARIADLMVRMTLDEKLAQLGSVWVYELLTDMAYDPAKAQQLMGQGIGQITRLAGASSLDPTACAELANRIQRFCMEETRLGIPAQIHEECCSGYMARNATCFPQIIGLASTWEPKLAEGMAAVVRDQMRAAGAHQGLSPVLDVTRDPRWGRVEETFGEDPYLTAAMGVSFVRGLQGDDWRQGVLATAKHFVGYGASEGGMNWAPPHIPDRELHEVYLFPFEAAVKEAGLRSIMHAYHELDGVPCVASKALLTDILRDDWGFDGTVVSDYFAIDELIRAHAIAADLAQAGQMALTAGVDVELPTTSGYGEPLRQAVERGEIDIAVIDRSLTLVLRDKFELGLFENPYVNSAATRTVFDTPAQRDLAREIARKSLVLLKNEGDLLPIRPHVRSLVVIGPQADTTRHLVGDYAHICHMETLIEMRDKGNVFDTPVPDRVDVDADFVPMNTILHALQERAGDDLVIRHAPGCTITGDDTSGFAAAAEAARQSELALLFVGGKSGLTDDCTCGEARDRAQIGLTGMQQQLIEAIHATGTPVALVLVDGRPLTIPWAAKHIPAILHAWLPGEEGAEAIAEVLFGDISPSGKLPISMPRTSGQIPIYYSHKPSGGKSHWKGAYADVSNEPQWPFGFGLSYTSFALENLRLDKAEAAIGDSVEVSVDVVNQGERAGEEVVQLYVRDEIASLTRPMQELKGFVRVALQPGERSTVTFALHSGQLGFYNQEMRYVVEPGDFVVKMGHSSADTPLSAHLHLTGDASLAVEKRFFSRARRQLV